MWEPGAGWKLLIQSADIWHLSLCAWVERHSKCAKRGWNTPGFTGGKFMLCIGQMKGCLSGFHCRCPLGIHHRYWDFHICLSVLRGGGTEVIHKLHWPSDLCFGFSEQLSGQQWEDLNSAWTLVCSEVVLGLCLFFFNTPHQFMGVSCNLDIKQDITEYAVFRWGSIGSFCSYFLLFKTSQWWFWKYHWSTLRTIHLKTL